MGQLGWQPATVKKKKKINRLRFYVHKLRRLIQQSEPILPVIISLWASFETQKIREKKNAKKKYFLMFSFTINIIKKNQIQSKFLKILHIFKFFNPYIIEINK